MPLTVVKRTSARAKATPGESYVIKGTPPPPGEGGRFKAITKALSKRKGIKNPKALAAWIGRRKWGKKKFQAMAVAGKKA